jgi:hypothetical protein
VLNGLLPTNADELQQLSLVLCIAYLFAAYAVWGALWVSKKNRQQINYVGKIFDAVTFATSLLALASIFDRGVLVLLGDLKPFLSIAGLCGGIYSLHALFKI